MFVTQSQQLLTLMLNPVILLSQNHHRSYGITETHPSLSLRKIEPRSGQLDMEFRGTLFGFVG